MPARVVTVPQVPISRTPPERISWRMRCTASKGSQPSGHLRDHAPRTPPSCRRKPAQALRDGHHAQRHGHVPIRRRHRRVRADPGDLGGAAADVEQQRPPVAPASAMGAQDSIASSASSRAEITLDRHAQRLGRARRGRQRRWLARRHASVATARACGRGDGRASARQTSQAPRSRGPWRRRTARPSRASPSPRRTIRLKLSTTRKPSGPRGAGHQQAAIVGARGPAPRARGHGWRPLRPHGWNSDLELS